MIEIVKPNINIDFIGKRKLYFYISTCAIVASIAVMVANVFIKGDPVNYGTDFKGGSQIHVEFSKAVTSAEVRGALEKSGFKGSTVVKVNDRPNFFMLRLTEVTAFSPAEQAKIEAELKSVFKDDFVGFDYQRGGDKVYVTFKRAAPVDDDEEEEPPAKAPEAKAPAAAADPVEDKPADQVAAKDGAEAAAKDGDKPTGEKAEEKAGDPAADKTAEQVAAKDGDKPTGDKGEDKTEEKAGDPVADKTAEQVAAKVTDAPAEKANATDKKNSEDQAFAEMIKKIEQAFSKGQIAVQQIQRFGKKENRTFEVSLAGLDSDIRKIFDSTMGAGVVKDVPQVEAVGAKMGKQLRDSGIKSVLYSLILILIYVAFRFDFRYAPGGVVALFHDIIIAMGLLAITWREFSMTTVAALLTIAGYSINDTIVVYDRIRENVAKYRDRKFPQVINASLNETLSRTILTSVTTLISSLAMLFIGAGDVAVFAFVFSFGIIIGTYSSIAVASPVTLWLNDRFAKKAMR